VSNKIDAQADYIEWRDGTVSVPQRRGKTRELISALKSESDRAGRSALTNGDATITIVGDPTAGIIRITVDNAKTATLEAGRYLDARSPSATSSRRCGSA